MKFRYRSALDEAAAPSDHVLLEHWATFCGRQLALRVSTTDATSPDTVAVHVRYGSGEAEVIISADEGSSEARGQMSGSRGPSSAVVQTLDPDAKTTVERKERKVCSPGEAEDTGRQAASALDHAFSAGIEEMPSLADEEQRDTTPLAVTNSDQALNPETERGELTACTSNRGQHDPEPSVAAAGDQAANPSKEHTMTSSSLSQEHKDSRFVAGGILGQEVDAAMEQAKKLFPSARKQQDSAPLSEKTLEKTVKLIEKRPENESCFSDQEEAQARLEESTPGQKNGEMEKSSVPTATLARDEMSSTEIVSSRKVLTPSQGSLSAHPAVPDLATSTPGATTASVTSRTCEDVVDASSARRTQLRIGRFDHPAVLDDKALEKLLQDMPALRCLSVEWRLDGRKLNIDIVSRYCKHLVEIDLTRFRLDTWSLQQLCMACPGLEVVKLPSKCDDSYVEVLLRNLPKLRSLDLVDSKVTGQFLGASHESLEKLALAGCKSLELKQLGKVRRSDESIPKTTCWEKIRELDLSSTQVTSTDVANIHRHFPRLERLSLAHCGKVESSGLYQLALCESLCDLDISHVGSLPASDLLNILIQCTKLERLALAGCTVMESSYLRQLDQNQVPLRLRELDVSDVRGLATVDLTAILARSPQLERLLAAQLDEMDLIPCLTQLSRCAELRELDVSRSGTPQHVARTEPGTKPKAGSKPSSRVFKTASRQSDEHQTSTTFNASSLSFRSFGSAPATAAESLFGPEALKRKDEQQGTCIFGVPSTEAGGKAPSHLPAGFTFGVTTGTAEAQPGIFSFGAASLGRATQSGHEPSAEMLDFISRQVQSTALTALFWGCQKLERLALAGCHITESASLRQLARCPKLIELDLSRVTTMKADDQMQGLCDCQSDSDNLAQGLRGCPMLERMSLEGLKAPLEQLVPPTGLPRLTYLDVSQSELTNNSLRRLPGLFPSLHTLSLQGCTSVSEDGLMSYLPCLQHLRSLDLRGVSGVTDALLEELKGCQLSRLRLFGLDGNKSITAEGLRNLALACPSLKLLGLQALADSVKKMMKDMIREQLPLHRVLVLCFKENKNVEGHRTEHFPQPGPLFVLGEDEVSWDKY